MTRRLRFAPLLAMVALTALPPASALAVWTPVLSPSVSPTNTAPALAWVDIDELTYEVLRDTAPCGPASGAGLVDVLPQDSISWTDLAAVSGTTYCYWVRGVDGGGPGAESNQQIVTYDTAPPTGTVTAPGTLTSVSGASVTVASADAADATAGVGTVTFQKSPAGADTWTLIALDSASGDGWFVAWDTTSLTDGLYDLRAVIADAAGNTANTAAVTSVRVDNTVPSAPQALTAMPSATNGSVTLFWPAPLGSDIAGYRVYRDGSGTSLNAGLVASTYTDNSLADDGSADGTHTYTLKADDLVHLSPDSNAVSVTLDTVTPAAAGVTATPQASGAINLSWSTPSDREAANGVTGTIADVLVRRSAAGGSAPASTTDGISVCTPGSAHSCSDTDTVRGATYAYAVFVRDEAGNSSRGTASAKASDAETTPDPTPGPKKPAVPLRVRTKVDHLGRTMLLWKLPADKTVVRIVVVRGTAKRKPRSPADGKRLYSGRGTTVAIPLAPGAATWVAVFALNKAGVASPAVTKRIAIGPISPGEGANLDGAVKLDWLKIAKADYYNVQIFRNGKRVLIDWPTGSKLSLANGKLANGDYTAYVWPGYGELSQARFGKLIGSASFSYRR